MDIKALQQMLQEAKAYLDCSQLTRDEYIKRLGDTREHLKELLPAGMVLLHDPHTGLTMLALGDETLAWQNTLNYLEEQERYQDPHALECSLEKEYRRRVEDYQHPPKVGLWR